jgi:hypothetical protein
MNGYPGPLYTQLSFIASLDLRPLHYFAPHTIIASPGNRHAQRCNSVLPISERFRIAWHLFMLSRRL